jgi:hypothetical protein
MMVVWQIPVEDNLLQRNRTFACQACSRTSSTKRDKSCHTLLIVVDQALTGCRPSLAKTLMWNNVMGTFSLMYELSV